LCGIVSEMRQSDQNAARVSTVDVLITVEGQHRDAELDVTRAIEDLTYLLSTHQPQAEVGSAILSVSSNRFPP